MNRLVQRNVRIDTYLVECLRTELRLFQYIADGDC